MHAEENMKHLYLGIDLGTSAMKVILIDENKQILANTTEEYQLCTPKEGWKEINQEIWFDSMIHGIETVLKDFDSSKVRSIGITGQMHTLVVLDQKGGYIRPALMWNDLRTKEFIPELKNIMRSFEEGEYLSKIISVGSPAANLFWLKKYEPENYRKIGKFLIGADYLVYRMTGHFGTDYCEASTSCLYEIKRRKWSEQMRAFLELEKNVYPDIKGSANAAGTITKEMAKRLKISEDVTVLTGTGDNPATAISSGCISNGYPVISLGTSGVLMMRVNPEWDNSYGKRILFSFDDRQFFNLVQGTVQSNGSTMDWWVSKILRDSDYTEIDQLVRLSEQKDNSILFYPHLAGDKTLYADPTLRGAFIGLHTNCELDKLTYSVLEGICFGFRELAEKMGLKLEKNSTVKVMGGGSKSKVWMQILANVLNVTIEKLDGMFGAAFGIALLASFRDQSKGDYADMLENTMEVNCRFEPEPEMSEICNRKYQMYKRCYNGLKYITEGISVCT